MIYRVERPFEYMDNLQELKVKCPTCGHSSVMPVFVDVKICNHCKHKVQNNTFTYFEYKLRKTMKERENMTDSEKNYIELEIMQELGLLEEGTNIMELQAQYEQEKKDQEITEMIEANEPEQELENHMVIGEYYENGSEE